MHKSRYERKKTGEYCHPKRLAQRHLQKKSFYFLRGMKLQQPWSRVHIPSCSAVTQHRPWAVGGSASAPTILRSHHTCRPTILVSISPTILRMHTCTSLAGLPYLLVGPSYYQTCRQAPHTFEYFEVFLTYFVSTSPHGLLHDVHNCVFM